MIHKHNKTLLKRMLILYVAALFLLMLAFIFDYDVLGLTTRAQNPFLIGFFYDITLLGEPCVFVFIALALALILMFYRRPIIAFILALVSSEIVEVAIKAIVQRPRPFEYLNTTSIIPTQLSSFPSGHAIIFFAMIPMLSKNFPKIKWIFWVVAILVGLSRIYLEVHYLSDVLAGAIIGYSIGLLFLKLEEKYAWKY